MDISDKGIERIKGFKDWREDEQASYRSIFGDIGFESHTPQAQLSDIHALQLDKLEKAFLFFVNGLNPNTAVGKQLDNLVAILPNQGRLKASNTTVTAEISGVVGTFVPKGSKAKTINGDLFHLKDDTKIDINNKATAVFVANDSGKIKVGVNELTNIVDYIAGWDSITNKLSGVEGRDEESDFELRTKYYDIFSSVGSGGFNNLKGALLTLTGVELVEVVENDDSIDYYIDGDGNLKNNSGIRIQKNSVYCLLKGGADQEVADTIALKKGYCCGTSGDIALSSKHNARDINFSRYKETPVKINIKIKRLDGYPAGGDNIIKQNLVDYFNRERHILDACVDVSVVKNKLYYDDLVSVIKLIKGVRILSIEFGEVGKSADNTPLELGFDILLTLDIKDIGIS